MCLCLPLVYQMSHLAAGVTEPCLQEGLTGAPVLEMTGFFVFFFLLL